MLYPNNLWKQAYPESVRPWIYLQCPFCNGTCELFIDDEVINNGT